MADSSVIVPFIQRAEGGLYNNPNDPASRNPCPYPNPADGTTGWHTNKGVTWTTWVETFGGSADSGNSFFAMNDQDWLAIFKPQYWDAVLGDQINSQRI